MDKNLSFSSLGDNSGLTHLKLVLRHQAYYTTTL